MTWCANKVKNTASQNYPLCVYTFYAYRFHTIYPYKTNFEQPLNPLQDAKTQSVVGLHEVAAHICSGEAFIEKNLIRISSLHPHSSLCYILVWLMKPTRIDSCPHHPSILQFSTESSVGEASSSNNPGLLIQLNHRKCRSESTKMAANLAFSYPLYTVQWLLWANQNTEFGRTKKSSKFDCWTTEMRYLGLFISVRLVILSITLVIFNRKHTWSSIPYLHTRSASTCPTFPTSMLAYAVDSSASLSGFFGAPVFKAFLSSTA